MYTEIDRIPIGEYFVDKKFRYLFKLDEIGYGKAISLNGSRYLEHYRQNQIEHKSQIRLANEYERKWLDKCILENKCISKSQINLEPQYEIY